MTSKARHTDSTGVFSLRAVISEPSHHTVRRLKPQGEATYSVPTDSTQWRSYLTARINHQLWKWMGLQMISAPSIQVIPVDAKWNRDQLTLPSSPTSNGRIMTKYKPLSFVVVCSVVIDNQNKVSNVLSSFYPWGNWGKARLCKLPKVTQRGSRIGTQQSNSREWALGHYAILHLISNW